MKRWVGRDLAEFIQSAAKGFETTMTSGSE